MATTRTRTVKQRSENTATVAKEATAPKEETVADNKQYRVKKNLDPNMIVTVRNGFQGTLVYKSKRTQERFLWESFGDEQDMELQELKNARNSSKSFFENNYFLIDDPEVITYLGVERYYKNALAYDTFDDLFRKTPDEIRDAVSKLSKGQRGSVAYRAKQLISDGEIDSIKVINALEEALSVELIER